MSASVKIGEILGIPIHIHYSWLLIFILITWSLGMGYFPQEYPELSSSVQFLMGAVTSLLFFGSVLLHELGHSWVALRNQIPVRSITLFIFGGVAQIEEEPHSPGVDFWVAIAGPLTSLCLGGIFGLIWLFDRNIPYLAAPSSYLMRINFVLALFNLIPGFPLDGGRVLRAIIWKVKQDKHQATQIASGIGQFVAFGFIAFGILQIFQGNLFNGLWLAFIGWFLEQAATSTQAESNLQQALKNITVGQVMQREHPHISGLLTLRQVVDDYILNGGRSYFCVTEPEGKLQGCLTLQDISKIPQNQWPYISVKSVAVPLDRMVTVSPHTQLLAALHIMDRAGVSRVPVIENGQIVGILSREDVLHFIRIKTELGI